ncbi:MAG: hypothetical protein ABI614_09195 [Planctomycetota bacterium]
MNAPRPRASRLQFSLRAVLIVLTLVAIGGWWWQKRFQEESTIRQRRSIDPVVPVAELTKTESKRRKGVGDPVLDGPTIIVNEEGTLILEEQWRQGVRHGTYRRWNDAGELLFECEFKRGRLIRVGDSVVANFMPSAEAAEDPIGRQILRKLHFETTFDYLNQPLDLVIEDISFNHRIPIMVDACGLDEAGIDIQSHITSQIRGVPLFVALVELLAPHNLTCAYRYDMLWVTTLGSTLHDDALARNVVSDHASVDLLIALSKPASFDYRAQSLGNVLEDQGLAHNITIESNLKDESEQVTLNLKTSSLRSALGILLYTHELQCDAIGDKLVITDADGKKPRRKPSRKVLPASDLTGDSSSGPFTDPFGGPAIQETPTNDPFSRPKSPDRAK